MQTRIKYRIDFNGGNMWFLKEREQIKAAVLELQQIKYAPQVFEVTETLNNEGKVIESKDKEIKEEL